MAKLALIVGASSGIGAAAAREFARRGYRVMLTARNAGALAEQARDIGAGADFFACDAAVPDDIRRLKAYMLEKQGVPDIIVNCAGLGQWKRIEDTTPEEGAQMIAAPYLAAFNACHLFMREWLGRRSGVLIHINSPGCYMPWPSSVGYAGARFALRGLHEALCQDLAGTGVHSCHIVFGYVDSPYFTHNPGSLERMPGIAATIRVLQPTECARIIADTAERPRIQAFYPLLLRVYFNCYRVMPGLVRWLVRVTGVKN